MCNCRRQHRHKKFNHHIFTIPFQLIFCSLVNGRGREDGGQRLSPPSFPH
nr:MAG TPA: hypothetical protein [Caudoviricetes sp.]